MANKQSDDGASTASRAPLNPKARQEPSKGADPALKWGITPTRAGPAEAKKQELPPDHPVHQMSQEEQDKLRAKGINPVLKAEMDAATKKGEGGFWSKVAQTSMGGGWIK